MKTLTCKDCKKFKYCIESYRMYPCRNFVRKEVMNKCLVKKTLKTK